jgi:hypothetical protein
VAAPLEDQAAMRKVCVQICSAWRKIALSTPRLWTSISLPLVDWKFDGQMSYIQTLCERAGNLPLFVSLHPKNPFFYLSTFPPKQSSNIPTLIPYLSRIKELSLSLSDDGFLSFCRLPIGSFPSLESCTLEVSVGSEIYGQLIPTTALESASRLQRFYFKNRFTPNFNLLLLRLPSHLTYLNIQSILTSSDLLELLRQCPNLEELAPVEFTSITPVSTGDMIVLPRLRGLDAGADDWHAQDTFFHHLTLPSLRKLDLRIGEDGILITRSLRFLLLRSLCPLEHLSLLATEIEPEIMLEYFGAVPSLVTLHLECTVIPVLDALKFVPGKPGNLLPKLQSICFIGAVGHVDNHPSADEPFAKMVESRWWPDEHGVDLNMNSCQVSRLTTVTLYSKARSPQHINTNVLRRIRDLRAEGLDVTLA